MTTSLLTQPLDVIVEPERGEITFSHLGLQQWWDTIRERLRQEGVEILLGTDATIPYMDQLDNRVSGYFGDRPKKILACATGKPDQGLWLSVLLHEACHFEQYAEQSPAWTNIFMTHPQTQAQVEATDIFFEWVAGTDHDPDLVEQAFQAVLAVETDCERRTTALMERFDFPFNRELYAKQANAYIHAYRWAYRHRQWYPSDRLPYQVASIIDACPPHIVDHWTTAMETAMEEAYADVVTPKSPRP